MIHFGDQPANQPLTYPGCAPRGIDEQVSQVADRGEPERMFMDDVVGNANDAVLSILGDDRKDR